MLRYGGPAVLLVQLRFPNCIAAARDGFSRFPKGSPALRLQGWGRLGVCQRQSPDSGCSGGRAASAASGQGQCQQQRALDVVMLHEWSPEDELDSASSSCAPQFSKSPMRGVFFSAGEVANSVLNRLCSEFLRGGRGRQSGYPIRTRKMEDTRPARAECGGVMHTRP
jgi:hypothetical protein